MKADKTRIKSYLTDIKKNSRELNQLIDNHELESESLSLKAAKYLLIELAEAMANSIQHVLAKEYGITVSGYIDSIVKANQNGIISQDLFQQLKPFFDFRNSLIHRYWSIDDDILVVNLYTGRNDFNRFVQELEQHLDI